MNEDIVYLITVIAVVLTITTVMIIVGFFTFTIWGAFEESDESYDFYGVRFIKYKDGRWILCVGDIFDENAVIKIFVPLLFRTLFYDDAIEFYSNGRKTGKSSERVSKTVYVYRKKVRRL